MKRVLAVFSIFSLLFLMACVNQNPQGNANKSARPGAIEKPTFSDEELFDLNKENENLKGIPEGNERIIVTSVALCEIMDKLEINLMAVPNTKLGNMPERYKDIPKIGMPMQPDTEVIAAMKPTIIYIPNSLEEWLKSGFEKFNLPAEFINLKSVEGLYQAVNKFGKRFQKEAIADKMEAEYKEFLEAYQNKNEGKEKKRVLLLMGLPGSYIAATKYSYAGSLLEMAGGENIIEASNGEEFLQVNVEALQQLDPDIILRTAHALPDTVQEMFDKEFQNNKMWQHFRAVKEEQVYDLNPRHFGMSALFNYQDALAEIEPILYGE